MTPERRTELQTILESCVLDDGNDPRQDAIDWLDANGWDGEEIVADYDDYETTFCDCVGMLHYDELVDALREFLDDEDIEFSLNKRLAAQFPVSRPRPPQIGGGGFLPNHQRRFSR